MPTSCRLLAADGGLNIYRQGGYDRLDTPKIYLDNCCYNRPFDDQTQMKIRLETEAKLYIQAGIRNGVYSLVWSYMLDYENSDNPYDEKRNTISPWEKIAADYCPSSDDVLSSGQEIMKHGIKPKDALHVACAIKSGCEYFITTDKRLSNKNIAGIRIVNPIDFIRETED
jgi:predicted nucleic acid-binding protein